MSVHSKRNLRRPRALGLVAGVALLLGGGFAAQAFADSGTKPAPAPAPATAPDAAPAVSTPGAPAPAPAPKVASPAKGAAAPGSTAAPAPAPADTAPRVISPGTGVRK
ncbi:MULTISPECIES: hypothetical protein [unclassified Streptomyces]|uniref:hypothetical protein n=1 Tax=unclassified Streptomyces TaxID=2593676 RepID=UPI002E37000D|nr:hypothetical protein [Streptomyces sp. NBC_01268]